MKSEVLSVPARPPAPARHQRAERAAERRDIARDSLVCVWRDTCRAELDLVARERGTPQCMEAGLTEALLTLCIAAALFYLVRAAGSSSVEVGGSAAMSDSVVTGVAKLGFPWQTSDPFLFCVYHDDLFPPGDEDLGPAIPQHLLWRGRNRGADFGGKWNMYHGEKV